MSSQRTITAHPHATVPDHGSEEDLSFPLVVILHLLPGALLMGAVLLLTPPLIGRGVPSDLIHIVSYNWPLICVIVLVNACVVWWKRNIYIAMLLHCSANTIGAGMTLISYFST